MTCDSVGSEARTTDGQSGIQYYQKYNHVTETFPDNDRCSSRPYVYDSTQDDRHFVPSHLTCDWNFVLSWLSSYNICIWPTILWSYPL